MMIRITVTMLLITLPICFHSWGKSVTDCPDAIAVLTSTRWRTLTIPVCWENASELSREKDLVRSAVQGAWERHSALQFVYWGPCRPGASGIHIKVEDTGFAPHTSGLGNQLDGKNGGMSLNFSFSNWSPSCQSRRDYCIQVIAVHEFGHALGFTHEANRKDAPDWCKGEAQGTDPDAVLTQYDPQSVMNCNPTYSNDGVLSPRDIEGVHIWYGKPASPTTRYDGTWTARLDYSDQTCQSDALRIVLHNGDIAGEAITPQGRHVPVRGRVDAESALQDVAFKFNAQDQVRVSGLFPHVQVRSSDCGCGSALFVRSGRN